MELAWCRDRRGSGIAGATLDYHHLPRTTYISPAIAADDLTDAAAVAAGTTREGPVLPLEYMCHAMVTDTRGVIKLVANETLAGCSART